MSPLFLIFYLSPRSFKRRLALAIFDYMDRKTPKPRPYEDHVLPHGDLEKLYNNLWMVRGTLPPRGPRLPRAMVIYRLPGTKDLIVHSAICVNDDVAKKIEDLGEITYIIVPNRAHRMDARPWSDRYPQAKVICPASARKYVEKYVTVHDVCEKVIDEHHNFMNHDVPKMPGISYMHVAEEHMELAYFVHVKGGEDPDFNALVVCDTFFNVSPEKAHWIARLMGTADGFGITKLGVVLAEDLPMLCKWVEKLRDNAKRMKIDCISMAHGDPVIGLDKVQHQLERAAILLRGAL